MRQWNSVDDLRRDFSDVSRRLDGYKGNSGDRQIQDPTLERDLRDIGEGITRFFSGTDSSSSSSGSGTTKSHATR